MPALDLELINHLGRELHPASTGLMSEDEVCPWTLFLTMALTLLKGVMPHVPKMLPVMISDPEVRRRAEEMFDSDDFKTNIDQFFVENIKNDIQAPLNRQILKSSETVMYSVDLLNNLVNTFLTPSGGIKGVDGSTNDLGKTDNMPRALAGIVNSGVLGNVMEFARTIYNLA
jgi:hypothetical protein